MSPPAAARNAGVVEKILVVEDDELLREALAIWLEGEGYAPVEAANGAAALHQLRSSERFCLILLDLFMPVMDGWAFRAEQLRDRDIASIPVIVISADASMDGKAATLGAVAFLAKPVDFDKLQRHVSEHC